MRQNQYHIFNNSSVRDLKQEVIDKPTVNHFATKNRQTSPNLLLYILAIAYM